MSNGYYHFSQIKSLTIGQSLDGERNPMFEVKLEAGAAPIVEVVLPDTVIKEEYLYVFSDRYCYLQDDKLVEDLSAYKEIRDVHARFKEGSLAKA